MENKTSAYLIAIVALVAVVGLVLMFTGSSSDTAYVVDEDGNIAGEAFRFSGKINTQLSTTTLNVQSLKDKGVSSIYLSDSADSCMPECRRNCEGTCQDEGATCLCVNRD